MNEKIKSISGFTKKTIIIVSALVFLVGCTCALMYFEIIPRPSFFSRTKSSVPDVSAPKEQQKRNENVNRINASLSYRNKAKFEAPIGTRNNHQSRNISRSVSHNRSNVKNLQIHTNQPSSRQDILNDQIIAPGNHRTAQTLIFKDCGYRSNGARDKHEQQDNSRNQHNILIMKPSSGSQHGFQQPIKQNHHPQIDGNSGSRGRLAKHEEQDKSRNQHKSPSMKPSNGSQHGFQQPLRQNHRPQMDGNDGSSGRKAAQSVFKMAQNPSAFCKTAKGTFVTLNKYLFYNFEYNTDIQGRKAFKAYQKVKKEIAGQGTLLNRDERDILIADLQTKRVTFTETDNIGFIYVLANVMLLNPAEVDDLCNINLTVEQNEHPNLFNLYIELACHIKLRGKNNFISLLQYEHYLYSLTEFKTKMSYLQTIKDLSKRAKKEAAVMRTQQTKDRARNKTYIRLPFWRIFEDVDRFFHPDQG